MRVEKIEQFLRTHPEDDSVRTRYDAPTCERAETNFSNIFQRGRIGNGEVKSRFGELAAKMYKADVLCANDWDENLPHTIPNHTVIIKNPKRIPYKDYGVTNALILVGDYLFIGKPTFRGVRVVRPVCGTEREPYFYQHSLRRSYNNLVSSTKGEIPPWINPS